MREVLQIINIGKCFPNYLSEEATRQSRFPGFLLGAQNALRKISPKRYRDSRWVLRGVDATFHRGEVVGLIGRNGSGKSTLLKLISRVHAPSEGSVVATGSIAALLEVGTGFQDELTGRENIYVNGAMLGFSKEFMDANIEKIIDYSEIGGYIDSPIKSYSSGMVVRLAFSVAIMVRADILILDEVLGVGDMAFSKKSTETMKELIKSGMTVILCSHSEQLIRQLCTRVIYLRDGVVTVDGSVDEAYSAYYEELDT